MTEPIHAPTYPGPVDTLVTPTCPDFAAFLTAAVREPWADPPAVVDDSPVAPDEWDGAAPANETVAQQCYRELGRRISKMVRSDSPAALIARLTAGDTGHE